MKPKQKIALTEYYLRKRIKRSISLIKLFYAIKLSLLKKKKVIWVDFL